MPFCQKCGAELQENAKFCPECGQPTGTAPVPSVSAETTTTQRKPILGLIGIVLILIGIGVAFANATIGILVLLVGVIILIFALFTGNVKVFG